MSDLMLTANRDNLEGVAEAALDGVAVRVVGFADGDSFVVGGDVRGEFPEDALTES